MALLFQCGLSCRLSQTLSVPLYPQSDCYICQQLPEEMPHTNTLTHSTHTHTKSSVLPAHTCSYKPCTWTEVLRRNKSWRAGWSPFCSLSKSFIFAPQQRCRHRNLPSRYSISFPTVKKKRKQGCVYLYAMCILVDPCVVKLCGYLVAWVRVLWRVSGCLRLSGCYYKQKGWKGRFMTSRQKAGKRQTVWRRNCSSPPQRGHRYITSHSI